ncbi:MAG: hypothetical protein NW224_23360 [Leptolyngbyaceae cyanobacterium bins.302]|nr:hypothetical protein [Leptolyngbyaceae cyanobacterium bins.302]
MKSTQFFAIALTSVIGLGNGAALATPVLNDNGDYVGSTTNGYMTWQVVDPDPKGLNCRMASRFQPASLDSIDNPLALGQDYQHDVSSWNVVFSFKTGEQLRAVIGNGRFNQIMKLDDQGKPWLGVNTWKGDCFVRANYRYVRPVGKPGWNK